MANQSNRSLEEYGSEEPTPSPGGVRMLWWIVALSLVGFVAFAGGMAFFTLNQRLPPPTLSPTQVAQVVQQATLTTTSISTVNQPTPLSVTVTTPLQVITPSQTTTPPQATAPQTTAPLATTPPAEAPVAATNTPLPTIPPATTATSTVSLPSTTATTCAPLAIPIDGFLNLQESGCPTSPAMLVWTAIESFERGIMLWRRDLDVSYILVANPGTGNLVEGAWRESPLRWQGEDTPGRGSPPPGLFAPTRGFGFVWGTDKQVFDQLGWARQEEVGFCAQLQSFEHGIVLLSTTAPTCTPENLYNRANDPGWQPVALFLRNDGLWRASVVVASLPTSAPTSASTASQITATATPLATLAATTMPSATPTLQADPSATPTVIVIGENNATRPIAQGVVVATTGIPLALDGRLDEWGANWIPVNTVVQGAENFTGAADLSGQFQAMWSVDGLYLAVRVQDELYRAGPEGTNLWQGDGLEIHFDRDLAGDFNDPTANSDDFQLGVGFGADRNQLRIYRWLPFALEAQFAGNGAMLANAQGYDVEILLPWSLFEMSGASVASAQNYGFNLSINDNDSDVPAQQSVVSASPARTTHDNPSEWGTLLLQ